MKLFAATATALLFFASSSFGQGTATVMDQSTTRDDQAVNSGWKSSLVVDGAYDKTPHRTTPLAWQPLREADVLWSKRVWREIDIHEKQNMPFRYAGDDMSGGGQFIEIILDGVKKGKLKAYSAYGEQADRFVTALTKDQIQEMLAGSIDSVPVTDPVSGVTTMSIIRSEFRLDVVNKFRIKEDVIFDRNLGRQVTRIIGIAPIMDVIDPNTQEVRGQTPMFWIYYPEAREVFAQYEVFNPDNDIQRITWDDYFEGRFFSSRIVRTSNPFNDRIADQYPGIQGLYQSQSESERLFNKEHDMWVY